MNKLMPIKTLDEYLKQVTTHATAKQKTVKPKYRIIGFYKETEFQETPIGKIPKEWKILRIKDLFNVVTGTTPSTKVKEYWEGGTINWITPQDLSKLKGKIKIHTSERKITEKALRETHLTLMPKGSIIISTRAPVGYVAVIKEPATFNQGCKGLIPKNKHSIITEFYAYYLVRLKPVLEAKSGGSTFKELSKNALENTLVLLPPLAEQWGIAEVLSGVDKAIEETERLIERLERLKKALIQELLTRGIGHKEFKETPIGKMPKEWKIVKIKEIASIAPGFASGKRDKNGVTQLRMDSISVYGYIDKNKYVKVPPRQNIEKYYLKPGDILLVNTSGSLEHLGKVALFRGEWDKCVYSNHLTRIRIIAKHVIPRWIYYVLYHRFISGYFKIIKVTQAGGQNNIHLDDLKNMLVPIPSLEEQYQITDMLNKINSWIELERIRKEKFERLKHGLMGLLLTGRVRVRVEHFS